MIKFRILTVIIILLAGITTRAGDEKDLFYRGLEQLKGQHYEAAAQTFTDLLTLSPANADVLKNRGVAYLKMNRFELALADFEAAKQINPDLDDIDTNLGTAWYYRGDFLKAVSVYDQGLARRDDPLLHYNRALALMKLDQLDRAMADIDRALELNPGFYWAYCLKGDLLLRQEKTGAARRAYEQAIAVDAALLCAHDKLKTLPPEDDIVYTIQVGAFRIQDNAQKLWAKAQQKGYDAGIVHHRDQQGRDWYLVCIGRIQGKEQARQSGEVLRRDLKMETILIPVNE